MGSPWRPRGPDDLDDEQRARIRRQVLRTVRPRHLTLSDRVFEIFSILALPAPHIVRAAIAMAVAVSIVATASVASADALPEEPLYAVKLAGEQLRLALATTPEDRAAVQLSMAEHRLSEAERLALAGKEADALVATSAYGTHLANAAAELAAVERLDAASRPVVGHLRQRLAEQQQRAGEFAARLIADPATSAGASLFETVASFAPALPSGASVAEGIAAHAATVAGQLAAVAERLAEEAERAEAETEESGQEEGASAVATAPPARPTGRPTERPRAAAAPDASARATARPTSAAASGPAEARPAVSAKPAAEPTAKPSADAAAKPTADPKKASDAQAARAAAEKAKAEAEKAKQAAERAKEAAAKTATPKPNPKR